MKPKKLLRKLVLNEGDGPYGLSKAAYAYLGFDWDEYVVNPLERAFPGLSKVVEPRGLYGIWNRDDEKLIDCVENLGDRASSTGAKLVVVQIPSFWEWKVIMDGDHDKLIITVDAKYTKNLGENFPAKRVGSS